MAEDSDSVEEEGQPTQEPADDEPVFGPDIPADTPDEDPEPPTEHPDEAPSSSTIDPEEQNRGYLRQQDYTRKTQSLADERRSFEAERQQFQAEMREQREQMQQVLQQVQQPQNQGFASQLDALAQDPNLAPADRKGVEVLQNMARTLDELRTENTTLREKVNQIEPQFQQTAQTVQSMTARQQEQMLRSVQTQLEEAKQMFGDETVSSQMDFVRKLAVENGNWNPGVNPKTGQQYTVAELVAWGAGIQAEETRQARSDRTAASRTAKRSVAPQGAQGPSKSRSSTYEDALSEIEATQRAGVASFG